MVEKICGKGEFWDLLLYQILSPYRSNCLDAGRESQIILGTLGPASLGLGVAERLETRCCPTLERDIVARIPQVLWKLRDGFKSELSREWFIC